MPKYRVDPVWTLLGTVEVEAADEAAARAYVLGPMPLPTDGRYLEDSCEIDSIELDEDLLAEPEEPA